MRDAAGYKQQVELFVAIFAITRHRHEACLEQHVCHVGYGAAIAPELEVLTFDKHCQCVTQYGRGALQHLFRRPFHVYPKEETDAVFPEATVKEPIEGAGLDVQAVVSRLLIPHVQRRFSRIRLLNDRGWNNTPVNVSARQGTGSICSRAAASVRYRNVAINHPMLRQRLGVASMDLGIRLIGMHLAIGCGHPNG
jgi:hypothetical protein